MNETAVEKVTRAGGAGASSPKSPQRDPVTWPVIAPQVSRETATAAEKSVLHGSRIGPWEWCLTGRGGQYLAGLAETAAGWTGYCECPAFVKAEKEAPGKPIPPCVHLVWIKAHRTAAEGSESSGAAERPPAAAPAPAGEEVVVVTQEVSPAPEVQAAEDRPERPTPVVTAVREVAGAPSAAPRAQVPVPVSEELTPDDVYARVVAVQGLMRKVMRDGEHYGTIPGCGPKPTLLKPGAEKLVMMFRLAPRYSVRLRDLGHGHREYEVVTEMYHAPSGMFLGAGLGSATTLESKWRWKWEDTGQPVPGPYWKSRDSSLLGGPDCAAKKNRDGKWTIHRKVETAPADYYNTALKLAKKRSLVDATLTVTAASDIFTQDIEEIVEATVEEPPVPEAGS